MSTLAGCDELHIAVHGTAGPACAREHHQALQGWAVGWHDDEWIERSPAGSGRELCWFPEPVGARDCYRGELPDPLLLHRSFPDIGRISARVSATRRDRFTARLPMLSPPHREGGIGALRVEARGHDERGARVTLVQGVAELIGTTAAAVAASFVDVIADGGLGPGVVTAGDESLPTATLLRAVAAPRRTPAGLHRHPVGLNEPPPCRRGRRQRPMAAAMRSTISARIGRGVAKLSRTCPASPQRTPSTSATPPRSWNTWPGSSPSSRPVQSSQAR